MRAILPALPVPQIVNWQFWTAVLPARLKRLWSIYLNWRLERAAINQLSSLSDRQLKDIGIDRSEIMGAVRRSATRGARFARYY